MSNPYTQFDDAIIEEFRANEGSVARFGKSLVLIHHIGAKSGIERVAPTMGIPDGPDVWLVAASKAGADDNPAWFHNLLAHPDVSIEVPGEGIVPVRATALAGDERDAAWARFLEAGPGFRAYEEKTTRVIPVVALTRRA